MMCKFRFTRAAAVFIALILACANSFSATCEDTFLSKSAVADVLMHQNALRTRSYTEVPLPPGGLLTPESASNLLRTFGTLPGAPGSRYAGKPFGLRQGYRIKSTSHRSDVIALAKEDPRVADLIPAFEWAKQVGFEIVAPMLLGTSHPKIIAESAAAIVKMAGVFADSSYAHTDDELFTIFVVLNPNGDPRLMTRIFDLNKITESNQRYESARTRFGRIGYIPIYWGGLAPQFYAKPSDAVVTTPGFAAVMIGNNWPEDAGGRIEPSRHAAPRGNWRNRQPVDRIAIAITFKIDYYGTSTDEETP